MSELQRLQEIFLKILTEAQKLRIKKSKWIGNELEWVIYERKLMLQAVNEERRKRGKPPVANVDKAEQTAMGHCDYTTKFALYCAEMI